MARLLTVARSAPPGFKLRYAQTESLDTGQPLDDYSAIYRPRTLGWTSSL